MATNFLKLRAVAALVGCASLLHVACNGDDDTTGNPTPSTGGTGAKGGTGGKAGKGGTSGDAGTGDTGTGGSTGGTGAKGGSGGTGAKGGKGGSSSGATGGDSGAGNATGNEGGTGDVSSGGGGAGGEGATGPTGCLESDLTNDNPPCYQACTPKQTDDSLEFLNHCADGSQTLGGVTSDSSPWVGTLTALGAGCKKIGDGCVLPALP